MKTIPLFHSREPSIRILKIYIVILFVFLISCEGNKTYYVQDEYRLSINTGDTIVYKESDNYDYYILDSIHQMFEISVSVGTFTTEDKYEFLKYKFNSLDENDTLSKSIKTYRGGGFCPVEWGWLFQ